MYHKNTLAVVLLCAVLVSSCTGFIQIGTQHPTATPPVIEQPLVALHRPYRVTEICLDTPPEYSNDLFHQATHTIADWIEAGVTVNQEGFVVYLGLITSS